VTVKFNAEKPTQQIEESESVMLRRSSRVRYRRSTSIGCIACLCVLLAMALAPQPIRAAGDESAQGKAEDWAEEGRNDLSLFIGVTRAGGESGLGLGLDYERRLSRRFGIGGVIEYTGGRHS
jgi:hypothetical protein